MTRRGGAAGALALVGLAIAAAPAAEAQTDDRLRALYEASLRNPGPQWAAISNHFSHQARCYDAGCVLMGPTDDRDACEEWAKAYNRDDPYDHARCVPASPLIDEQG